MRFAHQTPAIGPINYLDFGKNGFKNHTGYSLRRRWLKALARIAGVVTQAIDPVWQ